MISSPLRRIGTAVAALATVALVAVTLPASAGAVAEPLPGTATSKFVTGWFPYWYGPAELDRIISNTGSSGVVGEVMPFTLYSRYRDGGIQAPVCVHDGSDNKAQECARTAPTDQQKAELDRMHAAGLKVLPSLTDDGSKRALAGVMASPSKRHALVNAISNYVINNNYDGIDFDYEGFAFSDGHASWATTKIAWVQFIKELSAVMKPKGKLISVTVPAGEPVFNSDGTPTDSSTYDVYAWSDIIGLIDRLRLMTYDYTWPDCSFSCQGGPIGPADWMDKVASAAVMQLGTANAHKVWLGVVAYGYDWRTSSTCVSGNSFVGTKAAKYVDAPISKAWTTYQDAVNHRNGLRIKSALRWDSVKGEFTFGYTQADTNTATGAACANTREVWFQDGRSHGPSQALDATHAGSAAARAMIAAKYGLGGVALWALGDETDLFWSELRAYAPQVRPVRPVISLTAPAKVNYGTASTLLATVARPDGFPLSGVPVVLNWRASGTTSWTTVSSTRADAEGHAAFSAVPTRNGEWLATAVADIGRQSAKSTVRATSVATVVSASVRTAKVYGSTSVSARARSVIVGAMARDARGFISGYLSPVSGPQNVYLYKLNAKGALVQVAVTASTKYGHYTFPISTSKSGATQYRVRSAGTAQYVRGWSLPIVITVS